MADHLALTPSASSDSAIEGHSRSAKVATFSFAHIPNLATLENISIMNLPFPSSRSLADPYGSGRVRDRIQSWYQRNDGPWTPPGLTPPQSDLRNPAISSSLRENQFVFSTHYREGRVSSECDTVAPGVVPPSDSGYGGSYGAKRSVANGSVCDESLDRNQETQSLVGHIGDLNFHSYNQDIMPKGGVNPEAPWSQPQQSPSPSSAFGQQVSSRDKTCEICKKTLKTKSEFKKHKQRHEKPFKCSVKSCPRSEGFSTPNDLDRHIRSLHPEEDATGNRYKCPIGPCKNKDKIWPRADNFRAHMKRVHQKESITDEDLDQYKFSPATSSKATTDITHHSAAPASDGFMFPVGSENWTLPRDPVIDLSTETSPMEGPSQVEMEEAPPVNESGDECHLRTANSGHVQEVHPERDDVSLDEQTETPQSPSIQPCSTFNDNTEFAKSGQVHDRNYSLDYGETDSKLISDPSSPDHDKADEPKEPQDHHNGPSLENSQSDRQLEELTDIHMDSNTRTKLGALSDTRNLDPDELLKLLEELRNNSVFHSFLREHGYKKDDSPEQEVMKQEPARNTAPEQAHICSKCQKSFNRRCELKKHEKRHLKPYGCTFQHCKKKFGSKNDWKRHENSQHYMAEHWRCDEKQANDAAEICGIMIYEREQFRQHLVVHHHIKDSTILETKIERCRVGRNSEVRFWCGFCREIIEVKKDGIEAWTERFNHIDDHFHGRNNQERKKIDDWQDECPSNTRVESSANNSEDCGVTSSTPATSTNSSDTPGHPRLEKRQVRSTKQKRKRDDGCDESAKRHEVEEMLRRHCCQCTEMMPVTSKQCTNVPCDHKLCENCY
ncbi:uncharacterized protein GGS22DRAFT_161502 [Annulohypoxylon maeteangense]|uniref:uncharacterized protein n=1 Tax=Annulohypoxylon maeteangense TaxID=1927788 RepID=UPI002007DF78|nr:uncharacterized protein GGS22DRAFT_161502 [Annulohypoxylon maeteangense]KAI0885647.1 hypothetical protein GGS22DRAFT_161502 [Annulohypoxylon maeteangense]